MTAAGRIGLAARHTSPSSGYICLRCQLRVSTAVRTINPPVSLPYASRRHASWLEDKLRKKIWGTDRPPGQDDPYGKESIFDRKKRERGQEEEEETDVENPKDHTEYVKATTVEGLETVGEPGWGTREWVAENEFEGFMESERIDGRNDIILAVHRALVETYALKEAGLPLVMDYYSEDPTEDYAERVARDAQFEQDTNGQMGLVLENEELRQSILECVTPKDHGDIVIEETDVDEEEDSNDDVESSGAEERQSQSITTDDDTNLECEGSELAVADEDYIDSARSPSNLAALVPASDTWRNVSLEDAAIKFAVLKRVMQLTGRRIPDPDISIITTPTSLLVHLVKKPKPKRIAESLLNTNPIAHLPNVQIFNQRYGPIDREIEVGRWKVIKEELEKRGLPVTGREDVHTILREGKQ